MGRSAMNQSADFSAILLSKRLIAQRRDGPHTIASYRDTFRLLLKSCARR